MTRDIALKFNHIYGETFKIPEAHISKDIPLLSGTDGRKMSKSYKNYIELFDWMVQLGFPEDFAQAKNIYQKQRSVDFLADGPYSDATVTILNSAMQPNLEVQFEDCYPTALSDLQFSTTAPSVDYIECQATFRYKLFRILRLSSAGTTDTQSTNFA